MARIKEDLTGRIFGELEVIEYVGKGKWKCRCSCGNIKNIGTSHLTGGYVKTCGHNKDTNFKDLTRVRFGNLEVLRYAGDSMWECKCDCGEITLARSYELRNNITTKCKKCLNKEKSLHKLEDLTGKTFGEWTVLYYVGNKKWRCRCSCGTESDVLKNNLINGKSKSCVKCSQKKKLEDLTGKQFGEWTVLEYAGYGKWKCQCSCGNISEVNGSALKTGGSTRCLECEYKRRVKDMTGMKFGELEVLEYAGNGYWKCKCSCGKETVVLGYNLRSGHIKSCGNHSLIDLTGQKINEWEVLAYVGDGYWKCRCSCGTIKNIHGYELRSNTSKSCGCKKWEYTKNTLLDRYGEIAPIKLDNKRTLEQIKVLESEESLKCFIEGLGYTPSTLELSNELGVGIATTLRYLHKYNLENLVNIGIYSRFEDELANYISELLPNIDIDRHARINTNGKILELDIYIKELNLAIEFNGSYWHSDICKDKYYHQYKTLECAKQGIRLIHIFEYEWVDKIKKDKIKKWLKCIFNKEKLNRVYARQTVIKEISNEEMTIFLNNNHLQNTANASIRLGMYYNNELIGIMSFGKPRFTSNYDYELVRLAWRLDVQVIGGAEKLFNHFINNYKVNSIVSYCDISKFTGSVYKKLGFKASISDITEPNYVWVDIRTNEVLNRYSTMKHKLLEKGLGCYGDTEDEIMKNLGYLKVYDSGNLKFTWVRESTTQRLKPVASLRKNM